MARKTASPKAAARSRKGLAARSGGKTGAKSSRTGTPAKRARKAAGGRTAARKTAGRKTAARKTAGRKPAARKAASNRTAAKKTARGAAKSAGRAKSAKTAGRTSTPKTARKKTRAPRRGGTGRERTLAQTPEAGRTVKGPTNPFPTKRSTGTPAGAGNSRHAPGLERARRHLREVEETIQGPPSSLDLDRGPSAARTGRRELREARRDHPEVSPDITAGDVDADWAGAYDAGDEAPGGDNPTPDQDRVDDIGKALGVEYDDNEELKASDKIAARDRKRWELDPASSDDYLDRK